MRPEDQAYAPYYCEENVWHLAARLKSLGRPSFVTYISNPGRTCALWSQKASPTPGEPVIWDYHAILLAASPEGRTDVLDLDTTAGFPLPLMAYLNATFPFEDRVPNLFQPRFRVVEAEEHRRTFTSDRSHMRGRDGRLREPPAWKPIQAPGHPMNLFQFVDMEAPFVGRVMGLGGLRRRFGAS